MRQALVLALAVALLAGCGSNDKKPEEKKQSRLRQFTYKADAPSNRPTGVELPGEDAELTAPDGRTVKVSDYRGKPVLLVFTRGFMGSICPYCTTYTAQLAARREEIKALDATILLVYPTKETDEAKVKEFTDEVNLVLKEEGLEALPFPVFLDRGLAAVQRFNLSGDLSKPSTFVLDGKGVVRYCYVGEAPDDRPAIDRVVEELKKVQKGS
jgi:peroxiredoxin